MGHGQRKQEAASRRAWLGLGLAAAVGLSAAIVGRAQTVPDGAAKGAQVPPTDVTQMTTDGVYIRGTYYESRKGREAVPVICMHQLGKDRREYIPLAQMLQANGFAVLAIDLRGHGDSRSVNYDIYRHQWRRGVQPIRTPQQTLSADRFSQADYERMDRDVAAAKRFLVKENNSEKLNIRKLVLIGASIGSTAAVLYAHYDLYESSEGQDVQALVLLSPGYNYRGVNIGKHLQKVATRLPILTVVGTKDEQSYDSAVRIESLTKRGGSPLSLLMGLDTSLHGTALLGTDFRAKLYPDMTRWLMTATSQITPPPRWEKREIVELYE